ncbi:MAG: hypothetical protein LBI53_05240 [Candidatus Peribacteria bacterium]|nr:hypothetical protein [Candidatus Peribacteria bacterium]
MLELGGGAAEYYLQMLGRSIYKNLYPREYIIEIFNNTDHERPFSCILRYHI